MPKFKLVNPNGSVTVPALGNRVVNVGEIADFTDEQAAGLAGSDLWQAADDTAQVTPGDVPTV